MDNIWLWVYRIATTAMGCIICVYIYGLVLLLKGVFRLKKHGLKKD